MTKKTKKELVGDCTFTVRAIMPPQTFDWLTRQSRKLSRLDENTDEYDEQNELIQKELVKRMVLDPVISDEYWDADSDEATAARLLGLRLSKQFAELVEDQGAADAAEVKKK